MDDPWGSSQDTWSSPKPTAPSPLPESFNPGHVAVDDTGPQSTRRSSDVSDPWGVQAGSLTESVGAQWMRPEEEVSRDLPREEESVRDEVPPPPKSEWLEEDVGNAWAAAPVQIEDEQKNGNETLEEDSDEAEAPSQSQLQRPSADLPPHDVVLDSPQLPPLEHSAFSPTSSLPRLSHDSDSQIPRSFSHHSFGNITTDEEINHNPFSSVQSRSSTPLETSTITPPVSVTPLPHGLVSPSFSEGGFGGFADAAPDQAVDLSWGSPPDPVDDWGVAQEGGGKLSPQLEDDEEPVDGWDEGRAALAPIRGESSAAVGSSSKEYDWDIARREAERREARAPTELVGNLEKAWPSLVMQAFSLVEDETKRDRNEVVPQLDLETITKRDRMASELSVKPPTVEYFTPWNSTQTYARCSEAVAKTPVNASNSLLAQANKRSAGGGGMSISQLEKEWNVRSKLGEPDSDSSRSSKPLSVNTAQKPGWSIFGRKSSPSVPLTTSGGGILEVKSMVPDHTGSPSTHKATPTTAVPSVMPSSRTNSGSRPPSPALSPASGHQPSALAPVRTSGEFQPEEAPSAVGRFFGRFRRNRPASPSFDLSNKDMQLSNDDFSFLAEVPSMPPPQPEPGIGDLLGGNEDMNSLEHVLNSKQAQLPTALAPPPAMSHRPPSHTVPALSKPKVKEMDLFADLDFGGSPMTTAPTQPAPPKVMGKKNDLWDNMMAGPSLLSSPPPSRSPAIVQTTVKPAVTSLNEVDGFGEFSTTHSNQQASSTNNFNDYGDFFATATKSAQQNGSSPTRKAAVKTGPSHLEPSPNILASPKPTHFSGLGDAFGAATSYPSVEQFVTTAATQTGRWPAPPSPVPPLLAPPPSKAPVAGSFDFFANEPTTSPASARNSTPVMFLPPPPTSRPTSASPMHFPQGNTAIKPSPAATSGTQTGKGGLSAQDLSFFDSL